MKLTNNIQNTKDISISNYQLAHMVAQIRCKQLSCEESQNRMKDNLIANFEINKCNIDRIESNNQELTLDLKKKFIKYCSISKQLSEYLLNQPVKSVGFPNQRNRTNQQLILALEWIGQQDSYTLFDNLKNGKYLNQLPNKTNIDDNSNSNILLPTLESGGNKFYWGNENPSVTSLILFGLNKALGYSFNEELFLVGCGKRVEYLEESFKLPNEIIELINDYPFADNNSMVLFGSYQFGGQRKFNQQYLFGPEDCSSSVGKASSLKAEEVRHLATPKMVEAFYNSNNEYQFKAIVQLFNKATQQEIDKIEPGDIYLTNGHTGLFLTKPDFNNRNEALTIEFSRDLETETEYKCEGGGIRKIIFNNKIKNSKYYVLRPKTIKLSNSITLENLIKQIDNIYIQDYKSIVNTNIIGDCSVFINSLY